MKNIKAVALITDKKDHRMILHSIHFTGKEAVATDGFIIARTPSEVKEQNRFCEAYQKLTAKQTVNEDGNIVDENENLTQPKEIDVEYPPYERFLATKEKNSHHKVTLGIPVLEKLIKSLKASGQDAITLYFNKDNLKPVLGEVGDITYTIMPFKVRE